MGGQLRHRETAQTEPTGQNRRRAITPICAKRGNDRIQSPAIFMSQTPMGSLRAEIEKLAEASETPKQLRAVKIKKNKIDRFPLKRMTTYTCLKWSEFMHKLAQFRYT